MPTFQILYLRENVLDHSEEVDVLDLLEAIDRAVAKAPELTAEIRRDGGRIGLVAASPRSAVPHSAESAGPDPDHPRESEIAEEMKVRLRLVR